MHLCTWNIMSQDCFTSSSPLPGLLLTFAIPAGFVAHFRHCRRVHPLPRGLLLTCAIAEGSTPSCGVCCSWHGRPLRGMEVKCIWDTGIAPSGHGRPLRGHESTWRSLGSIAILVYSQPHLLYGAGAKDAFKNSELIKYKKIYAFMHFSTWILCIGIRCVLCILLHEFRTFESREFYAPFNVNSVNLNEECFMHFSTWKLYIWIRSVLCTYLRVFNASESGVFCALF